MTDTRGRRIAHLQQALQAHKDLPACSEVRTDPWANDISILWSPTNYISLRIGVNYIGATSFDALDTHIEVTAYLDDKTITEYDPRLKKWPFPWARDSIQDLEDDVDFVMSFCRRLKALRETYVIDAEGYFMRTGLAASQAGAVRAARSSRDLRVKDAALTHDRAIDLDSDNLEEMIGAVDTMYLLGSTMYELKKIVRRWMWSVALPTSGWKGIYHVALEYCEATDKKRAANVLQHMDEVVGQRWLVYIP
jgi:hypothetical protein